MPRASWAKAALPAVALLVLASVGCALLLLRRPEPMPSMTQTAALLRAQARGLFFSDRRTVGDMDKAVEEFRRAIAVDARFAEPHAALAESIVRRMEMTGEVGAAVEAEARREAARALDLDPQSSLGHAAGASVQFVLDRDMAAAERSFLTAAARRAARSRPSRRPSSSERTPASSIISRVSATSRAGSFSGATACSGWGGMSRVTSMRMSRMSFNDDLLFAAQDGAGDADSS